MGLTLSTRSIANLDNCIGKSMLASVRYSGTGSRCFSYPQYVVDGTSFLPISAEVFPDIGLLPMTIDKSSSPQQMEEQFGKIVIMRLNEAEIQENRFYSEKDPSQYNGYIDPRPTRRSLIEFVSFRQHTLSSTLVQVVGVQEDVSFERPIEGELHLVMGAADPQTRLVMVSREEGGAHVLYGPFEYRTVASQGILLSSSNSFDHRIVKVAASSLKFLIELRDADDGPFASFLSTDELKSLFDRASHTYDWLPDSELIDALGRIAKSGQAGFSKAQVRELKADIQTCQSASAKITLTDERRERLAGLINNYENWSNLPDDVKQSVLDEVPRDQLAEYVLSDEHFQSFYDRVIENEQVRERVEKDQARLIEQAEQSRADAERAAAEADERRHELEELNAQWDARQAELRREVDEQVAQARKALGELTATIEREGQELERIKGDKVIVERQIEAVVQDMSNSMTLSRRILEDEMIKQIVSSIAPRPVAEEPAEHAADRPERAAFTPAVPLFREDEEDMAPEKVLDEISRGVIDVADRDYTRNQVANLLICLTQGYILTLAGLPGTGKTSLAQILAGSLGLTRENASRFCEISVEKGWTSYKDFIGYYNPFTHQMEKSNAEVFDAFALLDAEAGKGGEGAPPYLFLLDEANLSSIEHYWSPFLRACDSFTRNGGSLSLGGDATFSVPSHVRFIATVNFDHTTEELSPRFLDRSWVITLDPQSMDFEGDELDGGAHDFSDWPTLRHETLERVFGVPRNPIPPQAQRAKVKEVLDACARHGWSVSPRSQRMMNGFICAASQLMDTSTAETTYAPVDYAVTQKVLPQLNGPAERLQGLLDELGQVGGLPLMSRRLERIVKVGEESGFYQYFS